VVPEQVQPAPARAAGRRRLAWALGCLLLLATVPGSAGSQRHARGWADVLVQGHGAAAALRLEGARALVALPLVGGMLGRVPAGAAGALAGHPGVRAVVDAERPLRVRGEADGTLDPGAAEAPAATPPEPVAPAGGGAGVAVGVLDTGIAPVADLAGRVVARVDLSGERSFTDSYGHGTFMAGLIAGDGAAGGPAGTAPGASLVDLRVAGADGATTLGRVLLALQLADLACERLHLRVLNLSLGAPADDPATAPLTEAVERLWADGIAVVTPAGNGGGAVDAPGLDPYVITVGAVDGAGGTVPAWSSSGPDFAGRPKPDLLAPGVGVVGLRAPGSTVDAEHPEARVGDAYFRGSGTSMATATVSGAAALLAAAHPGWGPNEIKAALAAGVDPLPGRGGAGALDVAAALGLDAVAPANGDLYPLHEAGLPRSDGWLAGGGGELRWAGGAGADPGAWAARSWAAEQWLARSWAARSWAALGFDSGEAAPAWAALQWAWGGALAGLPAGAWLARSWAARSWAARSWATREWEAAG
jgi:serine protease AprX